MTVPGGPRLIIGVLTTASVIGLWFFSSAQGLFPPWAFPAPHELWVAARRILFVGYGGGLLYEHILQSVRLILLGFLFATSIGVPLGLLMGWNRKAEALINPVFEIIRPIPAIAWIPLAIVWLGLDDASKIMILWFAAFVPAVINSYTGVRSIDRSLIEASQMLGVRGFALLKGVIIPGALPMIFTGLRLSLQGCLTAIVAAELLGAYLGVGKVLYQGGLDIYPAMILVGMIVVGLVGFTLTLVLDVCERLVTPWQRQ